MSARFADSFLKLSSTMFFLCDITVLIIKDVSIQGYQFPPVESHRIRRRKLNLPKKKTDNDIGLPGVSQCPKLILAIDTLLHSNNVLLLCLCGRSTGLSSVL